MATIKDLPDPGLIHIPRKDFVTDYWAYKPGEHATFLAPTQNGKTTLGFQLLGASTDEDLPGYVLVVKPADPVVAKWRKRLDYGLSRDWPPRRFPKKAGQVIWPRHQFDDGDDERHADVMSRALMGAFKRGGNITFADEILGLMQLGLKRVITRIHTQAAGLGSGLWVASQRPFEMVQTAFSQSEHLFLGPTPDKRDRDRYREIGGVDPELLEAVVDPKYGRLHKFQFLYVRRTGPELCVVNG